MEVHATTILVALVIPVHTTHIVGGEEAEGVLGHLGLELFVEI